MRAAREKLEQVSGVSRGVRPALAGDVAAQIPFARQRVASQCQELLESRRGQKRPPQVLCGQDRKIQQSKRPPEYPISLSVAKTGAGQGHERHPQRLELRGVEEFISIDPGRERLVPNAITELRVGRTE